jgi:hypothetical protein
MATKKKIIQLLKSFYITFEPGRLRECFYAFPFSGHLVIAQGWKSA